MTNGGEAQFGMKDMLILLNDKVDKLLGGLETKADAQEVLKLRERMHKVEGGQAVTNYLVTQVKDINEHIDGIHTRLTHVERNQITEGAVRAALEKQSAKFRNIAFALMTFIGANTLWNIFGT